MLESPRPLSAMANEPREASTARPTKRERNQTARLGPVDLVGIALMVLANYGLRRYLEPGNKIVSFLDTFNPGVIPKILDSGSGWRLFLPIPEISGSWSTTTLILTYFVERVLSPPVTWYAFNAIGIVATFWIAWSAFQSRAFAYTLALCLGFGTQLHHVYAVPGIVAFPLLFVYYQLLLLCSLRVLETDTPSRAWKAGFLGALGVTALAYESWLDFLVFAWLAWAYLAVALARAGFWSRLRGLNFLGASATAVGLLHVVLKVRLGYNQVPGTESDLVLNYRHLAPEIEDVLSNVLTHLYIAATNFVPPPLAPSMALYDFGPSWLIEAQEGYHATKSDLVPMHYLFLWRYFAGAVAVVIGYWLFRAIRRSLVSWSADHVALSLCLLMMVTGGPTHALVKFRPMNSAPILGYHAMIGVLGVSLLISYGAMVVRRRQSGARFVLIVGGLWAIILYAALTRPAWLGYYAVYLNVAALGAYPDPWRALGQLLSH